MGYQSALGWETYATGARLARVPPGVATTGLVVGASTVSVMRLL